MDGASGVGQATFPVVSFITPRRHTTLISVGIFTLSVCLSHLEVHVLNSLTRPVSCLLQGVTLLSYLYNEAQSNCSNENYPVLLSLLKSSCEPYTRSVIPAITLTMSTDLSHLSHLEFMLTCTPTNAFKMLVNNVPWPGCVPD